MRSFALVVFLFLSFATLAQQARQYAFRHFTTMNGLASNGTGAVLQDKDGYIWIGTQNGLQRYDGNNFITFRHRISDPSSIPSDYIAFMYQDGKGNLWLIGDNNRVGIFDLKRLVFKEVPVIGETPDFYLPSHVAELPTGETMLMRVDGTAFKYDDQKKQFIKGDDVLHVPPNWKCTHFAWDAVGKKLWLGCDSGLAQYNPVTKHVNYKEHNIDNDPIIKTYENVGQSSWLTVTKEGSLLFAVWPDMANA
ncbi:MAG: hypothetical protein J7502_14865, partial [Flavisolibacter sp.]|nr:hypothetical protein [Flavisolibacter sp.]